MVTNGMKGVLGRVGYEGEANLTLTVDAVEHLPHLKKGDPLAGVPVLNLYFHQDLPGIFKESEKPGGHGCYLLIGCLIAQIEFLFHLPVVGHNGVEVEGKLCGFF